MNQAEARRRVWGWLRVIVADGHELHDIIANEDLDEPDKRRLEKARRQVEKALALRAKEK